MAMTAFRKRWADGSCPALRIRHDSHREGFLFLRSEEVRAPIDTTTPPLQSWESLSFERRCPVLTPQKRNMFRSQAGNIIRYHLTNLKRVTESILSLVRRGIPS